MNGWLSIRGGNGTGANAGGGSGGTILIKTINMTGHGVISVSGGNGVGKGGGGAGGRVGIHCQWRYQYGGHFDNFGGDGGTFLPEYVSSHSGAAGTTYKEENFRELEYRHKKYDPVHNTTFLAVDHTYMHSDNIGKRSPAAAMIMEDDTVDYVFDEMELSGTARLLLYHPDSAPKVKLVVHRFLGDRSGQMHLRERQVAYVEVVESVSNKTEAPCSYIIDAGSEIVFPTEVHIHGTNSTLGGLITGVKHLFIEDEANVEFLSTAHTALQENGTYVRITAAGHFSFDTFTVKQGGLAGFRKITHVMHLQTSEFKVKYQGNLYMNEADIHSAYAWIESEGVFHFDGKGYGPELGPGAGPTVSGVGYGGAHGGYGGAASEEQAAHPYDSVFSPTEMGSGGGNGTGTGGSGGGTLFWQVGRYIELNGLLSLQGLPGESSNSGGGSGGSVLIQTTNMTGHGEINVRGGDGLGLGGGGAGGRIGIHCRWKYSYGGKFTNRGGSGSGVYELQHGGAAGTTFLENNLRPLEYRILKYLEDTNDTYLQVDHRYVHVDNEGKEVPVATMIMENQTEDYEFDELELTGHSRLVFYHPEGGETVTVVVHRFIGDKTGRVHIRDNQKLFSEVVESQRNVTEAPCSYVIDYRAELLLPSEVHLHGTNTVIDGLVTGVHHLYILDAAVVAVSSTAQTALMENQKYVHMTEEGNFSISTVNIKLGGLLSFSKIDHDMIISCAFLELKYRGTMVMNHGYIVAGDADLEAGAEITLEGTGHAAMQGPGAAGSRSGGSYGGMGGGTSSGIPYGSVFTPVHLGSGGGGTTGGAGGGHVNIKVGSMFYIDGLLNARGANAGSGVAGGGSGGTLLIESFNMGGHGTLDVSGGSGTGAAGCGGSGGRISVHITAENTFGGQYIASGGTGGKNSNHAVCDGGPGTIYKYESNRGPQYRELKYNPRLNATTVDPEHSKLIVDNLKLDTDNPAIVMEEDSIYYEFDEVQVEGYSYVHFYHPAYDALVNVVIHELTGNKMGLVRVQNRQRVIINFVASTHTYLDAPCGFHVDAGGEVVLPTTVIVLTETIILEGRMTGVEELVIERRGEFIMKKEGTYPGHSTEHRLVHRRPQSFFHSWAHPTPESVHQQRGKVHIPD